MKKILIIALVLLPLLNIFPQSAGTTGFEFLRSQYSPRGAAMGGNLMAIKDDIHGILYNPAALAGNSLRQWDIVYVDHLIDFKAGQLSYAQPFQKLGNIYAGLLYFNYGSFNETDEFGTETGQTVHASEFALMTGISNHLDEGFDYGLGVKFIYSSLDIYNASALALDAGLIYTVPRMTDFTLGISMLNLGKTINNYTSQTEKLPLIIQLGFAKRLAHLPLLFTGSLQDITLSGDNTINFLKRFAIGGEFDISEPIKFRLGYQNQINQDVKPVGRTILSGFSLGLGVHWQKLRLDYSYSNFGDLGSQNRLGVSGSF
jgi:hypothetical protein